jgi:hypothetical protein
MKVSVGFTNLGATIQKLQELAPKIDEAFAQELYLSAEEVMAEAKEKTPVDTGNLRASGHVQQPVIENGVISVELGFGGPAGAGNQGGDTNPEDVGYAEIVHEDLAANHVVGQAKFLEEPLLAMQSEIQARLNQAVEDVIAGRPPSNGGTSGGGSSSPVTRPATSGGPITPENPITDLDIPF